MTEQPPWTNVSQRPRVLLLGAGDRPNVAQNLDRLRSVVESHADIVLEDLAFHHDLSHCEADFVIVLGGDGSVLRAAKQMGSRQLPVLGVNLGSLGYLTPLKPEDLEHLLPEVCARRCRIVEHLMYRCQVQRNGRVLHQAIGLNEVAILGGPPFSILDVDLYVDAELATTYSCDGLIISTPVGSTAHCLSAGGPILRKNLHAFVILPISPHTLTVRPVVDSADRVLEAAVREPNEATSVVTDGRVLCRLRGEDRVRVECAEETFRMIEPNELNYYRTLREKLGWGGTIYGKDS